MTVVRDFLNVFPDDLPGVPPMRQIEFKIDLVPNTVLIAKVSYRLTPTDMKELSYLLQELLGK